MTRWGILGTGWIARAQTADLLIDGRTVSAVGSRTASAAREFADEFDIPAAHGSYEELVADPTVDAVYVATPHPFHAENARMALEAGKHVLVEKPFTISAVEAQAIVDLAADRGLVVLEAMWTRYLPHMVRIRELIAEGAIGALIALLADHDQLAPSDPAHRIQDPALGGGALLDLGIYPVSFAWDLFGAPSEVRALSTPTATGVDGSTSILLGFPGGQHAVIHTASSGRGPNRAVIVGTAARIEIDEVWYTPTSLRVIDPYGAVIEEFRSDVPGRGMQFQARALERLIEGGEAPELPPAETVEIMGTLDEVRRQIGLRYPGE